MLKSFSEIPNELRAREWALRWLAESVLRDMPMDQALSRVEQEASGAQLLTAQDKAFARRLVMAVLRAYRPYQTLLKPYLRKPISEQNAPVSLILLMGMTQLLSENIPPHAAVHSSVELCKLHGYERLTGLVNAVLKNCSRDKQALQDKLGAMPAKEWLPTWLFDAWRAAYGKEQMKPMLEAMKQSAPLDLSLKRASLEESASWAKTLSGEVLYRVEEGGAVIRLPAGAQVTELEGFEAGDWWVQDVAASLPAALLLAQLQGGKGKTIFDFCAAPGGKTMQLAASEANVVAVDASEARLLRVEENLQRTQLRERVELIRADLRDWQPQGMPDAIVLDAPCSATGTFRRHPDVLLNKRPKDVKEMVALQRAILKQLMSWLPVGVPVLYCVCSLQPEEGEQQIAWLQEEYEGVRVIPLQAGMAGELPDNSMLAEEGYVRTVPSMWAERGGMDGFFMAMFER